MAVFVINEWFWADSRGDNGPEGQRRAFSILERLVNSDDQILVVEGSAFDKKTWACCKSTNSAAQSLAKAFVTTIRQDSDRCQILSPDDTAELPGGLAGQIKPDDHYLVRAQLSVAGAILVTTDEPLRKIVLAAGLACLSLQEFLA